MVFLHGKLLPQLTSGSFIPHCGYFRMSPWPTSEVTLGRKSVTVPFLVSSSYEVVEAEHGQVSRKDCLWDWAHVEDRGGDVAVYSLQGNIVDCPVGDGNIVPSCKRSDWDFAEIFRWKIWIQVGVGANIVCVP